MSEQCKIFNAIKGLSQENRKRIRDWSTNYLKRNNIEFTSHNNGIHLKVGDYDFWPSTGMFLHKKTRTKGRGVFKLVKLLKINE